MISISMELNYKNTYMNYANASFEVEKEDSCVIIINSCFYLMEVQNGHKL